MLLLPLMLRSGIESALAAEPIDRRSFGWTSTRKSRANQADTHFLHRSASRVKRARARPVRRASKTGLTA
jgi:hypothetical protein